MHQDSTEDTVEAFAAWNFVGLKITFHRYQVNHLKWKSLILANLQVLSHSECRVKISQQTSEGLYTGIYSQQIWKQMYVLSKRFISSIIKLVNFHFIIQLPFKFKKVKSRIPESPIWCPKIVELRCVTLREYPPNGLSGSSVNVIVTEMFIGPESSRVCGDCVEDLACPLVTVLSGVVVSLMRCFKVSFSDIQKSKSLNLRRKVFQSLKQM